MTFFGDRRAATDGAPVLLALRALKLGDLLVAVPALRGLRRSFPEHRLIFAAPGWLEPIVELVGAIDGHLHVRGLDDPLPLEAGVVDVAVNLHGNGPQSAAAIDALAARLTIDHSRVRSDGSSLDGPEWRHGIHERERWVRLVKAFGVDAHVDDIELAVPGVPPAVPHAAVVHVGAFYGSRQWPVDRFARVAAELAREMPVVFTGSEAEASRAHEVALEAGMPETSVLAGRLRLDEFAAVIRSARVVVSADTGAAHLASAYRRPSVVIFGPAPPEEWGPPAHGPHVVLTAPELRVGETFSSEPDPALLAVTEDDVIAAVGRVLERDD